MIRVWVISIYSVRDIKTTLWYPWGGTFAWGSLRPTKNTVNSEPKPGISILLSLGSLLRVSARCACGAVLIPLPIPCVIFCRSRSLFWARYRACAKQAKYFLCARSSLQSPESEAVRFFNGQSGWDALRQSSPWLQATGAGWGRVL